jgi:DHA2 family multidrug resistance protein
MASILNQLVTQQSAMIGYLDAFKLMLVVCFFAVPLLLFLRPPSRGAVPAGPPAAAAMD